MKNDPNYIQCKVHISHKNIPIMYNHLQKFHDDSGLIPSNFVTDQKSLANEYCF